MKFLVTLATVFALTGCAGFNFDPLVEVAANAVDEPTVKSGMTSRDAAHMANYRRYVDKATADKPIVDIQGDGSEIKISGIKSIKVYGPTQHVQAPTAPKSALVEIMDSAGKLLSSVFIPWTIITETAQSTREADLNSLEASRITSGERQAVTSQAIEAASKDPLIVRP